MERKALFIKEKKKTIDNIKKKYKREDLSDNDCLKLASYRLTSNSLKIGTALVGVATVADIFIPDPVFGLDEAALAAITGFLGYTSNLVDNKIDSILKDEEKKFTNDDILGVVNGIGKVKNSVSDSRKKVLEKKLKM